MRYEARAADPKVGLTVAELEHLLRAAHAGGAVGRCVPTARVGWGGRVKSMTIDTEPPAPRPDGETRALPVAQLRTA